jgi:hypothetical protein
VHTLGIDLAAQPKNTAACSIIWNAREAKIDSLAVGLTDRDLLLRGRNADKIGIDVPFGWPTKFVRLVGTHFHGLMCEKSATRDLRYRTTDLYVNHLTGKWPLSVSTDRIGVTAFRAIGLLGELTSGSAIDRSGAGKLVEVYPAASLIQWGFPKTSKGDFAKLGKTLLSHIPTSLRIPPKHRKLLLHNRDAFDALIACLTARAVALGLCIAVPSDCAEVARIEGWIALPAKDSLARLIVST